MKEENWNSEKEYEVKSMKSYALPDTPICSRISG